MARTKMWARDFFRFERLKKFDCGNESIIGIKIGFPKQWKFNIFGYYRQWSHIFKNDKSIRLTFTQQEKNLKNQLEKIKEVYNIETIFMGELNIDFRIFGKNESEKISYEKNFSKMIQHIKNNLIENNFLQLITDNTRTHKILDHLYSNNMSKVNTIYLQIIK